MDIAKEIIRILSNGQTSQRDPIQTKENPLINLRIVDRLLYVSDNLGTLHRVDLNNETVDQILKIDGKEYNLSRFSGSLKGLANDDNKASLFSRAYRLVQENKDTLDNQKKEIEDISEILKQDSIFKFLFEYIDIDGDQPNNQEIDSIKNYYKEFQVEIIEQNVTFLQNNNLNFTMNAVQSFNENAKLYFYQACLNCIKSLKDLNINDVSYYDKLNVAFETLLIIARKLKTFQEVQSDLSKIS
jgi:hypothetical protein